MRDAVFGNVGTMVAFRIGGADGEIFEREFTPEITTQDFVNAPFAQIYVRLMISGLTSRPFSATTLPPMPKPAISYKDQVVESSRKKYGRARAEVTEYIRQWWQPIISEEERPARHDRDRGVSGGERERLERREKEGLQRRFQEERPSFRSRLEDRAGPRQFHPPRQEERFVRPEKREERFVPRREERDGRTSTRPIVSQDGQARPPEAFGRAPLTGASEPRTLSLHDLQKRSERDIARSQPKERNLNELREMLSQIRPTRPDHNRGGSGGPARLPIGAGGPARMLQAGGPQHKQPSPDQPKNEESQQSGQKPLQPGESVKLG